MLRPDPTGFPWAIRPAAVHLLGLLLLLPLVARGADLPAQAAIPVREVSVFKDGHAFVVHRGSVAVDAAGDTVLRHLPAPVMGTFWVGAIDGGAEQRGIGVAAVTASQSRVRVERTALSLKDLVDANPGAKVLVTETPSPSRDPVPYEATILAALRAAGGSLPLHDGSSPEAIERALHMSKKAFKRGVGGLYKAEKIAIDQQGIRLLAGPEEP